MFDFDFFDFLLVFEEGPEEVDDFDGFVFVGFLFVVEDFVDKVEEGFEEFEDGLDFGGEGVFGHVEIEFDGDGDVDEGFDDLLWVVLGFFDQWVTKEME